MAIVTAGLGQGTAVALQAREFAWSADQPEALGGTNTGPTPYELLLGGLAACIARGPRDRRKSYLAPDHPFSSASVTTVGISRYFSPPFL